MIKMNRWKYRGAALLLLLLPILGGCAGSRNEGNGFNRLPVIPTPEPSYSPPPNDNPPSAPF